MSTRACYRFIQPEKDMWGGAEVATVYKHSDGYPEGALEAIEAALEYAWPLPRFEADEFAAAFVAANKSQITYYERKARQAKAEGDKKEAKRFLESAEEYRTGRYKAYSGGGVRIVPAAGLDAHWAFASDTEYVYDISVVGDDLVVTAYVPHHGTYSRKPVKPGRLEQIFSGTLQQMKQWVGEDLIKRYTEELDELRAQPAEDNDYQTRRIAILEKGLAELRAQKVDA